MAVSWQPTASPFTLKARAAFFQAIRAFFAERGIYEVDVPILSQAGVTAIHLDSFNIFDPLTAQHRYLQTSPEYGMKRLLAAGNSSIYYLGKAFRQGEAGRRHNPEFTMLEWYRIDWDHLMLAEEVVTLLTTLLGCPKATYTTYEELFQTHFAINPHLATTQECQQIAINHEWVTSSFELNKDGWLDLLMTHGIEPHLAKEAPLVITDFPASQAGLAKIRHLSGKGYSVAERFEIYYQGLELANGYHELTCANEQRARFEEEEAQRKVLGLPQRSADPALLAALEAGLPPCAGVAVGVDRLFMLKQQQSSIAAVLPFAWENA